MAGDMHLLWNLSEEVTCPLCSEYFKDPVMILECGHNFCRICLDRCCAEAAEGRCPQCKQTFRWRNVGSNRQLANVAKTLSLRGAEGKERICKKHREPRNLFCRGDKTLICVTCEHRDHRGHETLLLEDAAQECTCQIVDHLEALSEKREKKLAQKGDTEREGQDLLEVIKVVREKIVMAFRQLRQFVDEQENCWLTQMDDTAKELERVTEDHLKELAKGLQSMERKIQEVEEKLQQPATDLLQDIEKFIESCLEAQSSENSAVTLPAVFKQKILDFYRFSFFQEVVMKQFQDTFVSRLPQQKGSPARPHVQLGITSSGEGGPPPSVEMGTQTMSLDGLRREFLELCAPMAQSDQAQELDYSVLEKRISAIEAQNSPPC